MFIFVLVLFFLSPLCAFADVVDDFNARKTEMITDGMLAWAWCEQCQSNFDYYNNLIWTHLKQIWWDQYATRSRRQGLVHMIRVRYQYPQCLTQSQKDELDSFFYDYFEGTLYGEEGFWSGAASANQQISVLVSMYIYGEHHPNATTYYAMNDQTNIWEDFTYEGRSYSRGNYYNLHEFTRDYLYHLFDQYIDKTHHENHWEYDMEMDTRTYGQSQLKGVLMVRDLAEDETMAHKADMMFTLIALNQKMDFSAKQMGGTFGDHAYTKTLNDNDANEFAWGIFGDWTSYKPTWKEPGGTSATWDYSVRYDSQSVCMISPRSYDPLVMEIGSVDTETDDAYAQYHIEQNASESDWVWVGGILDSANWNYLTKYYNLGGSRTEWILQVRPKETDPWGKERAFSFRFWANDDYCKDENGQLLDDCEDDNTLSHYMGKGNIQYKNAIFITQPGQRQVMAPDFYIESQQSLGGWTFYRIKTGEELNNGQEIEVVVAFENGNRALEVCIVGTDYPSFEAFKNAVLNNASVSDDSFTTSKGDVIAKDGQYDYGLINGEPIWGEYGYPIPDFPLMTTYDKDGNKMIDWDWASKILTLNHYGEKKVYNYIQWTVSDGDENKAPNSPHLEFQARN